MRVRLATKRDGPGRRPPPHSLGPFGGVWPCFGVFFGGRVHPFSVANAATHRHKAQGLKSIFERYTHDWGNPLPEFGTQAGAKTEATDNMHPRSARCWLLVAGCLLDL